MVKNTRNDRQNYGRDIFSFCDRNRSRDEILDIEDKGNEEFKSANIHYTPLFYACPFVRITNILLAPSVSGLHIVAPTFELSVVTRIILLKT
jgi:hypothetical protein